MLKNKIEKETIENTFYRKVIHTTSNMQLVYMSLDPGVEIGNEKHTTTTQFIKVEEGSVKLSNGQTLKAGDSVIIPPNTWHNVWCPKTQKTPAKLYTIYTPPEHPKDRKEKVKQLS